MIPVATSMTTLSRTSPHHLFIPTLDQPLAWPTNSHAKNPLLIPPTASLLLRPLTPLFHETPPSFASR